MRTDLLVVPEEHLDGQPSVSTHLEAVLQVAQGLDFVIGEIPAINLVVLFDTLLANRLRNDAPALLQTPHQKDLLRGLALLFGDLQQSRVFVQRRIGRTQARVTGRVDALRGVVGHQLRGRVVGMQFDLVDSWHNLGAGVVQEALQVLDAKVGHADVAHFPGGWQLLHLLPGTREPRINTPVPYNRMAGRAHLPGLDEIPVGEMLLQVLGIRGGWPVHQVQIDIV